MSQFSEHDPVRQELTFIDGLGELNQQGLPRRGWRRKVILVGLALFGIPLLFYAVVLIGTGLTSH